MFDFRDERPSHCPLCASRLAPPGYVSVENALINEHLIASERRAAFWHAAGQSALLDTGGDERRAIAHLASQLALEFEAARRDLPLRSVWRGLMRAALSRVDWAQAAAAWIGTNNDEPSAD